MNNKIRLIFAFLLSLVAPMAYADEMAGMNFNFSAGQGTYFERLSPVKEYVIRYGGQSNGKTAYVLHTIKAAEAECNEFLMDPFVGASVKSCSAAETNIPEPPDFTFCIGADGICDLSKFGFINGNKMFIRGRYGKGDAWIYFWAMGNFKCDLWAAGHDPMRNVVKECQISRSSLVDPTKVPGGWSATSTPCAQEDGECQLDGTLNRHLIAYGTENNLVMREVVGTSATCSVAAMRQDPAYGVRKACWTMPYPNITKASTTKGEWVPVQRCEGNNCGASKYTFAVGRKNVTNNKLTNTYRVEVANTLGFEAKVTGEYEGAGIELGASHSTTTTTTRENVSTILNSLTVEESQSGEINCKEGTNIVYQWQVTVQNTCTLQYLCPAIVTKPNIASCVIGSAKPAPLWG